MPLRAGGITFVRGADGHVYAQSRWPGRVMIARELLASADAAFMRSDGHSVTITVRNGRAVYVRDNARGEDWFILTSWTFIPMEQCDAA